MTHRYHFKIIIFQGWTKFYEFSMADLRAGSVTIDRLCDRAGKCASY